MQQPEEIDVVTSNSDNRSGRTRTSGEFQCPECPQVYSHRASLFKHRRQKHPQSASAGGQVRCLESECQFTTHSRKGLREHLIVAHQISMEEIQLTFESREAFIQWKRQYEGQDKCSFVASKGAIGNDEVSMQSYYCNRSGFFNSKGEVVDEFGEGFPVAWLISNREDRVVLTAFLRRIRDIVGEVAPKWVMTDDAEQYFNAWISVFAHRPSKLLCMWHVDRAWRGALRTHISGNVELQSSVYKALRCLLDEPDVVKFEAMLGQVTTDLLGDEGTRRFGEYFRSYVDRKSQWAVCYRKGSGINTNMYVEAFHHSLKYIYMKGFANRRVDKCVSLLMEFVKDKTFDRLVKLQKGKKSRRVNDIDSRHRLSLRLRSEDVKEVEVNRGGPPQGFDCAD
ncbi:uncharacterized protein [Diadema antillarum]|uniref:uncharacterized protein n=1 Tax=Diadema antillarum TaxID=105358 RepID=UPI003A873266